MTTYRHNYVVTQTYIRSVRMDQTHRSSKKQCRYLRMAGNFSSYLSCITFANFFKLLQKKQYFV